MNIAVVGGGFTGLTCALHLSRKGHQVTVFEKEAFFGGLAGTVKLSQWNWSVEQHYHHWFTNDVSAINLIKYLGLGKKLIFPKTLTSIYFDGQIYPFNSASHVLTFTPLSVADRIRTGVVSLFLKLLPVNFALRFERFKAINWLRSYYGQSAFDIVWKPLLTGKFGPYTDTVNMAWFWARVKKRTLTLGYLEGGYQTLIDALVKRIKDSGGQFFPSTLFDPKSVSSFDATIITVPSAVFVSMFPKLPAMYKKQLTLVPHLHALNLLLVTRQKLLSDTYWLNINDRKFPFIAVIQQTNMINEKHYGGYHLTWVANYLPANHPYLKISKEQLFQTYLPYLKKINPQFNFQSSILDYHVFLGSYAQPVFPQNYSKVKPDFQTPIPNVFLANMDMVYPWDRGTNYAIELGERITDLILQIKN